MSWLPYASEPGSGGSDEEPASPVTSRGVERDWEIPDGAQPILAGCCGCCCLTFLILLLCSFKALAPTEYGLKQNGINGIVDTTRIHTGGRNLIGFWNSYIVFPATLQTIEWTDYRPDAKTTNLPSMSVRTSEGLMVTIEIVAQYFLQKEQIPLMYTTYKLSYESFFISVLRSSFQLVIADWTAQELWTERERVKTALKAECDQVASTLIQNMITCWDVQLLSVHLDDMIEGRIIDRQVQQQQQNLELTKQKSLLIRANTTVQEAALDKEVTVVNAEAQRDAYIILESNKSLAEYNTEVAYAQVLSTTHATVRGNDYTMSSGQLVQYYQNSALLGAKDAEMVFGNYGGGVNVYTKRAKSPPQTQGRLLTPQEQPSETDVGAEAARLLTPAHAAAGVSSSVVPGSVAEL